MNRKRLFILGSATLVLLAVLFLGPFRFVDNLFYDLNFVFSASPPGDSVAVVALDPESISEIGALPWPRSTMARLFEIIDSCGPRAVAPDFLFQRRTGSRENDSLAAVFSRMPNLVLAFRAGKVEARTTQRTPLVPKDIYTHRFLRLRHQEQLNNTLFYQVMRFEAPDSQFVPHAAYGGFLNVSTSNTSQKLREVIHVLESGGEYYPSFGLAATAAFYDLRPSEIVLDGAGPRVVLDSASVPLTSYAASTFLNYRSDMSSVTVPAADVLKGTFNRTLLHDRLVFVGVTDPAAAADFFTTPVRSQFPGVQVWATAALDIIQRSWIKRGGIGGVVNVVLALLLFPGLMFLLPVRRNVLGLVISCAIVGLSIVLSIVLFRTQGYFWSPGSHLYAWVFSVIWLAAQKVDPSLARQPALELEPPQGDEAMPPPRQEDYLSTVPRTPTATHVLTTIGSLNPPTQEKDAPAQTALGTIIESSPGNGSGSGAVPPAPEGDTITITDTAMQRFRDLSNGSIVSLLGCGGMADVYLVWNPRLEVYRAVKVLKPGQEKTFLDRFETEIRIFSKLNHPNIVHCYGVGEWHGLPCVEMEYVGGTAMDRLIAQRGRLTAPAALGIGILVCRALHYAHNAAVAIYGQTYRGIVHRDLKPANILLSTTGRVKLTDFGIARPGAVSLHTTELGSIVGTLPYLAPEQIDSGSVTARTDIYALGATLYEVLTGKKAFPQEEVAALVSAKSRGMVDPMTVAPELPRRVIDIVNRAMAVDPSQRHATAEELGLELETALRSIAKQKPYAYLTQLAAPPRHEEQTNS